MHRPGECVSHDTETHVVQDGLKVPPLVVGSAAWWDGAGFRGVLLPKRESTEFFEAVLDSDQVVAGANLPYDLCVELRALAERGIDAFPKVRKLLEEDRAYDLQYAQMLDAIAAGQLGVDPRTLQKLQAKSRGGKGHYSLDNCVDWVLGRQDAKANDEFRLRFHELENIPIELWPPPARDYPVDDARNTVECSLAQVGAIDRVPPRHTWREAPGTPEDGTCADCGTSNPSTPCRARRPNRNLVDLGAQVRFATAAYLGGAWGFRIDQAAVDVIERHVSRDRAKAVVPFQQAGLIRPDGSENQSELKRRVAIAYGSKDPCPTCAGTGKVLSPSAKPVRCRRCRGTMFSSTIGQGPTPCEECGGAGKKAYGPLINCFAADSTGEKTKTCDGTGLLLVDDVPRTDKGGVGTGADVLHESGDEFLMSYGDYGEDDKIPGTYIPYLRGARKCAYCGRPGSTKEPHLDTCPTLPQVTT